MILAWFYLTQAFRYARDWNETTLLLTMKSVPVPPVLLFVGLVGIVLGSLSLLFGFRTRAGALTLFGITIAATLTMHDYWHLQTPMAREADYDVFARNIAIAGGLLTLLGLGAGKFSMDSAEKPAHGAAKPGGAKPAAHH
jgi:putative oxidoreductase